MQAMEQYWVRSLCLTCLPVERSFGGRDYQYCRSCFRCLRECGFFYHLKFVFLPSPGSTPDSMRSPAKIILSRDLNLSKASLLLGKLSMPQACCRAVPCRAWHGCSWMLLLQWRTDCKSFGCSWRAAIAPKSPCFLLQNRSCDQWRRWNLSLARSAFAWLSSE